MMNSETDSSCNRENNNSWRMKSTTDSSNSFSLRTSFSKTLGGWHVLDPKELLRRSMKVWTFFVGVLKRCEG